jgi:hypothetical protein
MEPEMGTEVNRVLLALVMIAATACVADDMPEASFAVADSAGVEVVTTTTPAWGESGSPWRLTLEVEIGELEGAEPYLFGDPVAAVQFDDGRIAVADAQSADIRFFDMNGNYLYRAGRQGQGPGEFTSFSWLARCGDGLLAYDWQQRRATPISLGGEAGDPFPVSTPEEGSPVYQSRCLPDGSFLAVGWGETPPLPTGQQYLFHKQTAELWRMFPPGDSTVTIGTYISSERLRHLRGSGPHPFSRSVVFAARGDQLLIGGAERLQIEVRSLDGELLEIYRGPDAELVIDEGFLSSYRRAELSPGDSMMRAQLEAAEFPMPERYPAYTDLLADPLGYVWVERFAPPWEPDDRAWGVFDPDGVFLGHLQVPPRFDLTDVTADHVLTRARYRFRFWGG